MTVMFNPGGRLNIAADSADLPEDEANGNITSTSMRRCKNLRLDRNGIAITRFGSSKLNTEAMGSIDHITEMNGVRYEFGGDRIYRDEELIDIATTVTTEISDSGDVWAQVSQASGTAIGDMTLYGGLAASFDGADSTVSSSCSAVAAGAGYVGKDWGAGNTRRIAKVQTWASNNEGYFNNNVPMTLTLRGSNDGTTWTSLGSVSFTDGITAQPKEITATVTTAFRYHSVYTYAALGFECYFAEIIFWEIL